MSEDTHKFGNIDLRAHLQIDNMSCRPYPLTWRDLDLKTDSEKAKKPPGAGTGPTEIRFWV
jgi:hypothetical protein